MRKNNYERKINEEKENFKKNMKKKLKIQLKKMKTIKLTLRK